MTTTDILCRSCKHSVHVITDGLFCQSPQVQARYGPGSKVRCIGEVDGYVETTRQRPEHRKCGIGMRNFEKREP